MDASEPLQTNILDILSWNRPAAVITTITSTPCHRHQCCELLQTRSEDDAGKVYGTGAETAGAVVKVTVVTDNTTQAAFVDKSMKPVCVE